MVMELVLIRAPARLQWDLVDRAKKMKGVVDAYPVFGRFDIAVLIKGRDFKEIGSVAARVAGIEGIRATETLPESD
jgi:GTP cyclohydrolase III